MGRPSLYTPELIDQICQRLETGEPMAQICRSEGMPAVRTVTDWMEQRPDVSASIARARIIGFDAIAAETLEISDDARNDYMEKLGDEGNPVGYILNGENIQRSRLRVDTRLKLLAKWDPKRYGDAMTLKGDKENPLAQAPDDRIDARLAVLLGKSSKAEE